MPGDALADSNLEAIACPSTIHHVEGAAPPAPLSPAAGVALLVAADPTTPLFLAGAVDCPALRDWLAFLIGAPLVLAEKAVFALGTWTALQPVSRFRTGQPDCPDRSATLIVETGRLDA
ncbi:phosphonate C-P lyase system protein PhnH [Paracoccus sp. MC1854]|uniref:phosphonate C-P lyase system protein PhnH n=1 Tax=Paracoccus sp. MC1854 TaxID=2760306 RepID=UPI0021023AA1|nr:phosphonate C-P lyase system protein PhnH [Paracoccus sp. MC1854]